MFLLVYPWHVFSVSVLRLCLWRLRSYVHPSALTLPADAVRCPVRKWHARCVVVRGRLGWLGGRGWAFFELWLDSRRWRVLGAGRHGRKARHYRMGYWRSQKSKTSRARHPHTNQCAKPEFTFIDKFKMGCLSPWQRAVSSSSVVGDSCLGVCLMYIIISSCKIVFV